MLKTSHSLRIHKTKRIAFVEIDGKRIYLGRADDPNIEAIYHQMMADRLTAARAPRYAGPTVAEICAEYLQYAES